MRGSQKIRMAEFHRFMGVYNKTAEKIKTVISIFSFYLVKSVRTVRTAKMAHMRIGL